MKQFKFDIEGQELELNLITSWEEMNLKTFLKFTTYVEKMNDLSEIDLEEDTEENVTEIISILTNQELWVIEQLTPNQIFEMSDDCNFISTTPKALDSNIFEIYGQKYMHRKTMSVISTGERTKIKLAIKQFDNNQTKWLPIMMATLIRECELMDDGINYRMKPLISNTPEGLEEFENRKNLFLESLFVPQFTGLSNAFFALSTK